MRVQQRPEAGSSLFVPEAVLRGLDVAPDNWAGTWLGPKQSAKGTKSSCPTLPAHAGKRLGEGTLRITALPQAAPSLAHREGLRCPLELAPFPLQNPTTEFSPPGDAQDWGKEGHVYGLSAPPPNQGLAIAPWIEQTWTQAP